MGSAFPRSQLWRPGAGITAGIVDAGYEGAIGALLKVKNSNSLVLHENAKLASLYSRRRQKRSKHTKESTSSPQLATGAMGHRSHRLVEYQILIERSRPSYNAEQCEN